MSERTELELGFEGGRLVRCAVDEEEAGTLECADHASADGHMVLAAEGGTVVVDLRCVVYLRRLERPPHDRLRRALSSAHHADRL